MSGQKNFSNLFLFVFQRRGRSASGASGGSGAAPLKNKKKEGWLRWGYKQATPGGVWGLGAVHKQFPVASGLVRVSLLAAVAI